MVHINQEKRKESIQNVKEYLAASQMNMPNGVPEGKFQAYLSRKFGFSKQKINDYLSILLETGEIEFDLEDLKWKLVLSTKTS